MTTIYQFDDQKIFTGQTQQIAPTEGAPFGWTRTAPPAIPEGKFAQFSGRDGWVIIDERPAPVPVPVPESVTARQARQWMIENDIMPSQVDAMIADIEDEKERELLKNYWEYSTLYQRNHPLLIALGERLNLTPEQLDQAFREASKL